MGAPVFLCGFNIEKHFFHSIIFHYHFIKNLRKNGRLPGDNSCSSIVTCKLYQKQSPKVRTLRIAASRHMCDIQKVTEKFEVGVSFRRKKTACSLFLQAGRVQS
jgi:hypothetical protein